MFNKRVATQSTVIPLEWDKEQGFNQWAIDIRNQLHVPDESFGIYDIVKVTNKIIKHHKPSKS